MPIVLQSGARVAARSVLTAVLLAVATCAQAQAQTLPELLQAVLEHPDITARHAQELAAERQLDAATAAYFGSGVAGVEQTTYDDSQFLGTFTPAAFASPPFARTQWRYGASYNLPIDLFGAIAANRARARSDVDAARLAERQQTLMKLHETLDAWERLRAIASRDRAVALEHERVAATVARVRGEVASGLSSSADLALAESELARAESEAQHLHAERAGLLAVLEDASGRSVTAEPDSEGMTAAAVPSWPVPDTAHETLPVRAAAAQAAAAADAAQAADRALLPAVSAGAGYARFDGGGAAEDTWNVGARVTVPLDPGAWRRRSAAAAQAHAAADAEAAARRRSGREWIVLKAGYDAAMADIDASSKEVAGRRAVVAVREELARVGSLTVEDALRSERDLIDAEARYADARVRAVDAWSAAQVLLGVAPDAYINAIAAR
jgi:outer membrane protein TolC